MPCAVRSLILPSVVPIADMRQRCAVSGFIIAAIVGLLIVSIQTHGLPVVYIFPTTKLGIRMLRSKCRNIYACFSSHTICIGRDCCVVVTVCIILAINLRVRNPVFQPDGICSRCLIHNMYSIRCIADLSGGCANRYTGEGEGSYILRFRNNLVQRPLAACISRCTIAIFFFIAAGLHRFT